MFEPDVVGEFAGWVCHYTPTIMSGPVFRWSPKSDTARRFEVSASREGVMVQGGSPVMSGPTVFDFVQVLDLAGQTVHWLAETREDTNKVKAKIRAAKGVS